MSEPGEELFGRIAIKKGLLNEDQLFRVLRMQEDARALGLETPLGELLVMDGTLKAEQVELVLKLQRLNEKASAERRFGLSAVANGFITAEELEAALRQLRKESFRHTLGDVLVARGSLSFSAAKAIRQALERAERTKRGLAASEGPDGELDGELEVRPESPTTRLANTLDLPPDEGLASERRLLDVLFGAVALRDGAVLVPELERALSEQLTRGSARRTLAQVLVERGVLSGNEVRAVEEAVERSRRERLDIPGYEVLEVLGGGATSIVVRARHELIEREVAIKLLHADPLARAGLDDAQGGSQDAIAEAKTIARIRHPNVVGLYEVGRVHRRLYYVMELVQGPTLREVIDTQGSLAETRGLEIARDVAKALQAIEAEGLVHRDVKPANIVLTPEGLAKLTDLGLARDVDGKDEAPQAIYGTPYTLSPEQAHGDPVDIRADLYGLGATVFHALTGSPPYEGDQFVTVVLGHLTEPVPDPRERRPELSAGCAALIQELMAKDRAERPQTPAELVERLERLRESAEADG